MPLCYKAYNLTKKGTFLSYYSIRNFFITTNRNINVNNMLKLNKSKVIFKIQTCIYYHLFNRSFLDLKGLIQFFKFNHTNFRQFYCAYFLKNESFKRAKVNILDPNSQICIHFGAQQIWFLEKQHRKIFWSFVFKPLIFKHTLLYG